MSGSIQFGAERTARVPGGSLNLFAEVHDPGESENYLVTAGKRSLKLALAAQKLAKNSALIIIS